MTYEKPQIEVITVNDEFMTGSGNSGLVNGHCDTYNFPGSLGEMGYSCSGYNEGSGCSTFKTNVYSCSGYNGNSCSSVTISGKAYSNWRQNCNHF